MRWPATFLIGLSAVAAVATTQGLTSTPSTARAASACDSGRLRLISSGPSARGQVPVVFVHGIGGSPAIWQQPQLDGSASIADRVSGINGTTVSAFDYHQSSLEWVTDPRIGPALASDIDCLAGSTGNRVILIDHSMGGLASQYAAAQPDGSGGTIASHIAEVITIGTPFEGSKLLSVIQNVIRGGETRSAVSDPGLTVVAEALLSACAGLGEHELASGNGNPCGLLAVPRSPVGRDLMFRSAAIQRLPGWPPSLPVKAIAGDIKITIGVWPLRRTFDLGDVLVSQDSATAHNTDGQPASVTCMDTVLQLLRGSMCYHGQLPGNPRVVDEIVAIVSRNVRRERPPTPRPQPVPTQPKPAPAPPPATTAETKGYAVGDTFDDECQVAWPTAPTRTSTEIQMHMECVHLPDKYLLAVVIYPDPNFPITPSTGRLHVHGRVADVAVSGYGFKELVVAADRLSK